MEWWQILLILLGSIVIGVSVGVLISYSINRFVLKRKGKSVVAFLSQVMEPLTKRRREAPVLEKPSAYRAPDLAGDVPVKPEAAPVLEKPPAYRAPDLAGDVPVKPEAASVVEEPLKPDTPGLFSEVEANFRLATSPWTGKLLSFQTNAWDTSRAEVDKLSSDVRDALGQAYIDIRLSNNIVRLSIEFNHRTGSLDENYQKLCATIAERINRIKLLMEPSGK